MTAYTPEYGLYYNSLDQTANCEIESVTIYGGRYDTVTQPTPRVATFQITPLGSFTAPNLGDEIYLNVLGFYGYPIFYGFVTDVTFSYRNFGNGNGIPTFQVTATAHIATLDWNTCTPSVTYSLDYAGAQILAMMSDWQQGNRGTVTYNSTTMPQTGGATLDAVTPTDTDNLGDVIRYTASSAGGVFYERANGDVYYDRRADRNSRSAFTLSASDIDSGVSFTKSITAIGNSITVARTGTDATASDSTSISKFGKRDGIRDTRLHVLSEAQTIANSFIAGFKSPVWRPDVISCNLSNPDMTNTTRANLLDVFCGSKVTIPIPSEIGGGTGTYFVENFMWTLGVGTLTVTLGLAPTNDSI